MMTRVRMQPFKIKKRKTKVNKKKPVMKKRMKQKKRRKEIEYLI